MVTLHDGFNQELPGKYSLRYFHHDQLGSIAAITNEAGAIVERLAHTL
jgi:hypothetical protein